MLLSATSLTKVEESLLSLLSTAVENFNTYTVKMRPTTRNLNLFLVDICYLKPKFGGCQGSGSAS